MIATLTAVLLSGGYFLLRRYAKSEKAVALAIKILGGTALACFLCLIFFVPVAMTTDSGTPGYFDPNVGNVLLLGVPYGENKAGNFFALLGLWFFLASAPLSALLALLPYRKGHFLNKYVLLPNLALSLIFLFNLEYAFLGEPVISYKSTLIALTLGLSLGLSIIHLFAYEKQSKRFTGKEIGFGLVAFFLVLIAFMPMGAPAMLLPTDGSLFGMAQVAWRIQDFSFLHRLYIYIGIVYYVLVYFFLRNEEENGRRVIVLLVAIGALASFFTRYGFEGIFDVNNGYKLNVNSLPIHLCHTALFITPLCVGFKWKRLFYFTYFINVFGAIMAMIWPNVGERLNILDPDVLLFWYNHFAAACLPLLAVMFGLFPRPKMRQMFYSLLAFLVYFIAILFANAFLSNFVAGYDPNVLDSGTDYLFINGTYILDILGEDAKHMLDVKWSFQAGGNTLVFYPLYQGLFFLSYALIAFAMWFVYSLFYRIEDSHIELHARYLIARSHRLNWKERKKMQRLTPETLSQEASLVFENFSKRYLNSSRFSADHVNLEVHGGEIFGFLGPNGAGKSTCIKTAIGIQPVTEGSIRVCGYDVSEESVKAKKCIGYVPDHYALYEKLTGREYINYVADLYGVSQQDRDERIAYYVDLFELNHSFDARMQTYSHGMKQKIAIIAALVHEPKVWILDEPLTGLDPQSIYQVKKTMLHHAEKGNVVFFSSHIIDVVERLCTRIAVIRKGKIVYTGTMEETLKAHPEGLEEFYMSLIEEGLDEE